MSEPAKTNDANAPPAETAPPAPATVPVSESRNLESASSGSPANPKGSENGVGEAAGTNPGTAEPPAATAAGTEGAKPDAARPDGGAKRAPKKKVAILIAYIGAKYSGLQKQQDDVPTIESEVERALHLAGCISDMNFGHLQKIAWSRAARTDKGVHALTNVVGAKLMMPEGFIEAANSHLPEDIRIVGVSRATNGFNAKNDSARRRYRYLLPVKALAPPTAEDGSFQPVLTDEMHGGLTRVLEEYVGRHAFHNFTQGILPGSAQAMRHMFSLEASRSPIVDPVDGSHWIDITIVGQSFMLHQIRKMISVAVAVARGEARHEDIFPLIFDETKRFPTSAAPANGLFLDEVLYDPGYNKRHPHAKIECSVTCAAARETFLRERLVPFIIAEERRSGFWDIHTLAGTRSPFKLKEIEVTEKHREAEREKKRINDVKKVESAHKRGRWGYSNGDSKNNAASSATAEGKPSDDKSDAAGN